MMIKEIDVGLFYGESFYEVTFCESALASSIQNSKQGQQRTLKQVLFHERFYAPKFSLKSQLPKVFHDFKIKNPEIEFNSLVISSRLPEKIFNFNLGGSVAQLVSHGFERWLQIHQKNIIENAFKIESPPELSSNDYIISVKEKIDAQGNVMVSLSENHIDEIVEKLKKISAKRVCLHLIHSEINPIHHDLLKTKMEENQWEVFTPSNFYDTRKKEHDYPLWRSNLIEASISGTFMDLKNEIAESVKDFISADKIYFLSPRGTLNNGEMGTRLENILSFESVIFSALSLNQLAPANSDIFHFGFENFSFLSPQKKYWQSPWGPTHIECINRKDLKIQPTNSFYLNSFDEIDTTQSEITFEPGPMSFERGRTPCVFDILNSESLSKDLHKRVKDTFWALVRSSKTSHSEVNTFDEFREIILKRLAWEVNFLCQSENLVLYGYWAEKFEPQLRKLFTKKNLIVVKESLYPKSLFILMSNQL